MDINSLTTSLECCESLFSDSRIKQRKTNARDYDVFRRPAIFLRLFGDAPADVSLCQFNRPKEQIQGEWRIKTHVVLEVEASTREPVRNYLISHGIIVIFSFCHHLQDSARDNEPSSHGRCNSRDDGLYPPSNSHPDTLAYPVNHYRDPFTVFLGGCSFHNWSDPTIHKFVGKVSDR